MSRSHQYNSVDPVKAATAIVRGVAGTFIAADNARMQVIDHRVQRAGEAIAILGSYIAYRIDIMNDILKDEKVVPFVQKLRKADAKIKELKDTIAAIRQKQNYKARPKGPSNPLNL